MSKICVIGNSHISAFVHGWREIADNYPQIAFEFFGAPGTKMSRLEVSKGSLVPKSGILRKVLAANVQKKEISGRYDVYLVCGLRSGILHMEALFNQFRVEKFAPDGRAPVSDECFARALRGCVAGSLAITTVRKLREITSAPIGVIPDPLPTKNYTECEFVNRAEETGEAQIVANLFEAACRSVVRDLDAECYFQPTSTKSDILRTNATYSEGAVRLHEARGKRHRIASSRKTESNLAIMSPRSLSKHMNGAFGALYLEGILGAFASRLAPG